MKKRLTQREAIFYQLYQEFKKAPGEYIPVFRFMGETYSEELKKWGYVSHECSARCSELKSDMPDLIQSTVIRGKSGAKYYGYRINPLAQGEMIKDKNLFEFYKKIKK